MPYDSLVLRAAIDELQSQLINAKINKVHQPDERTVILRYYSKDGNGRLIICAHPQNGRLHKTKSNPENPAKAPLFVMVLRKWLEGSRITKIEAVEDERIANIYFAAHNDLGDSVELRLVIEIMGKHSNIILVDSEGIILDGIRRYGSALSRYREVLPGKAYLSPPPIAKMGFVPASEAALAEVLYSSESAIDAALQQKLKGISPILAKNIPLWAGISPDISCDSLGSYEISCLYQQLQRLNQARQNQAYQPTLLLEKGRIKDYYAWDLPGWDETKKQACASINEAIDAFFIEKEQEQAFAKRQNIIAKSLRQHKNRLQKKIRIEEADLANCEAAAKYKDAGDLLSANLYYLQKGMASIELPSFFAENELITIALDPAKSPQENIKHYYKRYSKAKNARQLIEEQLERNVQELDYLLSIEQSLEDSLEMADLDIIESEAARAGFYQHKSPAKKKNAPDATQLPPRKYLSEDGFTILIGRNNKQNDRLSLKTAHGDDIWLHTQKIPGAHTLIVANGRKIPPDTIAEAAAYAAWFSKARQSGKTAVDYTFAKNIHKPNGSVPGYVIYGGQETIYTEPKNPDEK